MVGVVLKHERDVVRERHHRSLRTTRPKRLPVRPNGLSLIVTALSGSSRLARFGPFRLDITTGELHREDRKVRRQHQPFQILVLLLAAMDGFETPLAAWRVHATAADLVDRTESTEQATRHREASQATILMLANSLPPEHRLRATFLSSVPVTRIRSD
jgi:hypothetical protein